MGNRRATAPAPIEAGAVETEMTDTSGAPSVPAPGTEEDAAPIPFPANAPATQAVLTGPQLAEIKARNETVDRANRDARAAQDEAFQKARLAQFAQEALTTHVGQLIAWHDLDPDHRYHVDLNRGMIVSDGRLQQATVAVQPKG